jgi:hypothetical protein
VRVVRELLHLLRRDVRELRPAIADVHAPQAGHAVEVLAAVGIDDGRVLRGGDDELALLELLVGHDGMDHVVEVAAHEIGAVADRGGLGLVVIACPSRLHAFSGTASSLGL